MKHPIVLVGSQSFWSQLESVRSLLPNGTIFRLDDKLRGDDDDCQNTLALVVADQPIKEFHFSRFPSLKVIARTGTGFDNIDMPTAKSRGVIVTRAAQHNAEAVSEFALGCIFELTKNFSAMHQSMMNGKWQRQSAIRFSDLSVGVVGLGHIGRSLVYKLHHLGTQHILGWNRTLRPEIERVVETCRLECVSLDQLMKKSNVVVLAVALAKETEKLIGEKQLSLMKQDAFLINICRGAVVDEMALARYVSDGLIGGVALDVYSGEPPVSDLHSSPFMVSLKESALNGRRVILSPHVAGLTKRSVERISAQVACNIAGVLKGDLSDIEVLQ